MNSKHRKTLAAIFSEPVPGSIEWAAIEGLLLAAGARLIEGRGSRVRFEKDGEVVAFHRPHPAKEANARIPRRKQSGTRCAMHAIFWTGSGSGHEQHHDLQGLCSPDRV
ncbi:type II toxin-antitoxin system HicA family toxin [Pannonibacter indicus]|uniref:type II toxin-antitoxin system HicA family toxin n=1 Tax=Pannonibacter indicus TaxID=466044 RepID=UPI001FCBD331|nr:type II toxin-antitoxin system HicA family toxin [Pannonibacter indicus]